MFEIAKILISKKQIAIAILICTSDRLNLNFQKANGLALTRRISMQQPRGIAFLTFRKKRQPLFTGLFAIATSWADIFNSCIFTAIIAPKEVTMHVHDG